MKIDPFYDLKKYREIVELISDICPFNNNLINELNCIGENLKKFNNSIFDFDNNFSRITLEVAKIKEEFNQNTDNFEKLNFNQAVYDDNKSTNICLDFDTHKYPKKVDATDSDYIKLYNSFDKSVKSLLDNVLKLDQILFAKQIIQKRKKLEEIYVTLQNDEKFYCKKDEVINKCKEIKSLFENLKPKPLLKLFTKKLKAVNSFEERLNNNTSKINERYNQIKTIKDKIEQELNICDILLSDLTNTNAKNKLTYTNEEFIQNSISHSIDSIAKFNREIIKAQQELDDLSMENCNTSQMYPSFVCVGKMYYTYPQLCVTIKTPIIVDIPFLQTLIVPESSQIAPILLRFVWAIPQGSLEIIAFDQETSGQNIQPINDLLDIPDLLCVVTETGNLQKILEDLDNYMGKINLKYFKNGINSWGAYNKKFPTKPLPCKIIAVCSLCGLESCGDLSEKLFKIMRYGSTYGVFVILSYTAILNSEDRIKENFQFVSLFNIDKPLSLVKCLRNSYEPLKNPDNLSDKINDFKEKIKKINNKSIHNLFVNIPMWESTSADGLMAPIGWDANKHPIYFKLDTGGTEGTAVHALVGGQTGSGKSVLLHTLIQSLAYVYSPEELQFYLFDFKSGVEFNKYVDIQGGIWMPHIQLLSVKNDSYYASKLFNHLVKVEIPKRNGVFKKSGVGKIGDYVKYGGKMPRLIVIVDEFQELFKVEEDENVGEELTNDLITIVNQGRNVGIHLLIATQAMSSAHRMMKGRSSEFLNQIKLRLALWGLGDEEILASNNKGAAKIVPQKQCIINLNGGLVDENVVFDFPFSSPDTPDGKVYRKMLEEKTRQYKYTLNGKMFDGSKFPSQPSLQELKDIISELETQAFWGLNLGVYADFSRTYFSVLFEDASDHLLVGAEDNGELFGGLLSTDAWSGICSSIINNLKVSNDCAIFYYNPISVAISNDLPDNCLSANRNTEEIELLSLLKKFVQLPHKRKVLVVENYHKAVLLHPEDKSWGVSQVTNNEETAKSIFLSAFKDSREIPFSVVLLIKNVHSTCQNILGRYNSEVNILEACKKRIAFNVVGDALGIMIPNSGYNQKNGPRRVWYEDTKSGFVTSFIPYAKN